MKPKKSSILGANWPKRVNRLPRKGPAGYRTVRRRAGARGWRAPPEGPVEPPRPRRQLEPPATKAQRAGDCAAQAAAVRRAVSERSGRRGAVARVGQRPPPFAVNSPSDVLVENGDLHPAVLPLGPPGGDRPVIAEARRIDPPRVHLAAIDEIPHHGAGPRARQLPVGRVEV